MCPVTIIFFKQKTAYEMRISDWSSDVCSSDLLVDIDDDRAFNLHPGEFVLGSTFERIAVADDLVARIEGKSSLGRLGLLIHSTAGVIDAGCDGHITLELSNVANMPITLYQGEKIGQISVLQNGRE